MSARPISTVKVRVAVIMDHWDMRGVHKLRSSTKANRLKQGSCLIAFNKAQTMARIIDWKGGVHTYYAEPKTIFDLGTLRELVKVAFYVDLEPGQVAKRQQRELLDRAA